MEQAAQLKTILEGLLVPDNAARQAAEAALEQAQKTQPSPFLLALLTLCGDWCVDELKRANGASCVDAAAEIRTMAAVLLRRKIQAHYNALDDATKTQIQRWLATSLTTPPPENEPNLARKLGDIVAAVATLDEGFSEDVKPALLNALSTNQTAGALEALVRGDFVDEGAFSTQCAPRLARLCASTDASVGTAERVSATVADSSAASSTGSCESGDSTEAPAPEAKSPTTRSSTRSLRTLAKGARCASSSHGSPRSQSASPTDYGTCAWRVRRVPSRSCSSLTASSAPTRSPSAPSM